MKRFFMIGNTHFDPVWVWKWDEGDLLLVYCVTNHGGAPTKAMLRYGDWTQQIAMAPFEIKTLKLNGSAAETIYMTEDSV